MTTRHERLGAAARRMEVLSVAVAAVCAAGLFQLAPAEPAGAREGRAQAPVAASPSASAPPSPSASASPAAAPLKRSAPVRLALPQTGTDVRVARSDAKAGDLPAPPEKAGLAWSAAGPAPGERGAAVLVGRGGTQRGAPLRELDGLRPGAQVVVWRKDGGPARFAVDSVEVFSSFTPTAKAAAPADPEAAELRLVATAKPGGEGPYVVAFAHLLP